MEFGYAATVVYGDTDSLFVVNEQAKIRELLEWVRENSGLEIKLEREYRQILFTGVRKRYAGVLPDGDLEIVGLEAIRNDWTEVARQVQEQVLRRILEDQSTEKAVETVRTSIQQLRKRQIPVSALTIHKTLTKPLERYAVRAPHVKVASKLLNEGQSVTVGEKVAYVIVKGPGKLFQKAESPDKVKPEEIDTEYYVENQIKPAAMSILERFHIEI